MQEGVNEHPSLPAAVRHQRLKLYGVVGDGVVALAQTQRLSVEHALHLEHELPRRPQARQVGDPRRCSPSLRPPGQMSNDVSDSGDIGGERLGLEVEDQLTLGQERPTTSRGSVVPLGGGESQLPDAGRCGTEQFLIKSVNVFCWFHMNIDIAQYLSHVGISSLSINILF